MVESPNVEYVDLFKRIAVFTNTFHQRPVGTGERARSSKGHLGKKVYWTSTNTLTNQLFENQTSQNFVSRKLWNSELSTQWLSRPISNFPDFTKFKNWSSKFELQTMSRSDWATQCGNCLTHDQWVDFSGYIKFSDILMLFSFPFY